MGRGGWGDTISISSLDVFAAHRCQKALVTRRPAHSGADMSVGPFESIGTAQVKLFRTHRPWWWRCIGPLCCG